MSKCQASVGAGSQCDAPAVASVTYRLYGRTWTKKLCNAHRLRIRMLEADKANDCAVYTDVKLT